MKLGEKIKLLEKRYITKKKVKGFLNNYSDIIDKVDWFLPFPRIYLLGETHYEKKHIELASGLIELLKPKILFAEAAGGILKPTNSVWTFDSLLEEYGLKGSIPFLLNNIKTSYLKRVDVSKKLNHDTMEKLKNIRLRETDKKYFDDPSLLLSTYFYYLSRSEFGLFLDAFRKLITEESAQIRAELQKEHETLFTENRLEEKYEHLDAWLSFLNIPNEASYSDISKLEPKYNIVERFSDKLIRMINFWKNLHDMEYKLKFKPRSRRATIRYSIDRKVDVVNLLRICSEQGTVIQAFDDVEAQNEYRELFKKEKLTDEESCRLDEKREKKMKEILLTELSKDSNLIGITYGGAHHIRKNSPVILELRRKLIPYYRIILSKTDKSYLSIKDFMYVAQLKRGNK